MNPCLFYRRTISPCLIVLSCVLGHAASAATDSTVPALSEPTTATPPIAVKPSTAGTDAAAKAIPGFEVLDRLREAAAPLGKKADEAEAAGKMDEALRLGERILAEYPNTPAALAAKLRIGRQYSARREYDKAIAIFNEVVSDYKELKKPLDAAQRSSKRSDAASFLATLLTGQPEVQMRQEISHLAGSAQVEIGDCLCEKGDYGGALEAFRLTGPALPPGGLMCGNAMAGVFFEYYQSEADKYEQNGKYSQAVCCYFAAISNPLVGWVLGSTDDVPIHLLNLYEAAGQTDDLMAIIDQFDPPKPDLTQVPSYEASFRRSFKMMRHVIEMKRKSEKREWSFLIAALQDKKAMAGPETPGIRHDNLEACEAARLLAKHPEETVPLLAQKARDLHSKPEDILNLQWVWYALGQCGTPEAVALLKQYSSNPGGGRWVYSLAYAMQIAGPAGQSALDELVKANNFEAGMKYLLLLNQSRPPEPKPIKIPRGYCLPTRF